MSDYSTEESLKEQLMFQARNKKICKPGYEEMRVSDIDGLVDYYIANPDWCMERGFPTLPFLKENFSNIGNKGVFVNRIFHGELLNDLQTYIFHNCKGTIKVGLNVDKAIIPMLYLANRCRLHIVGVGDIMPKVPSEVPIYSFGRNDVSARDNKFVKFTQYKAGLI